MADSCRSTRIHAYANWFAATLLTYYDTYWYYYAGSGKYESVRVGRYSVRGGRVMPIAGNEKIF